MSRILLTSIFLSFFYFSGEAQNTFNKQYYFDGIAAIGNGIHVTDSCYYISGLVVDTIDGETRDGLLMAKLALNGEIINSLIHYDSVHTYENWLTPLIFNNGNFISVGLGADSINYGYWLRLNNDFEIEDETYFRSYYYPERNFIVPVDFIVHPNGTSYIASTTSFEESSGVVNINTSVLKIDSDGQQDWYLPYGGSWVEKPSCITSLNGGLIAIGGNLANYNFTNLNLVYKTLITIIDTNGQVQWTWTSPNQVEQGANDMIAEPDGSLIVASGRGYLYDVNPQTRYVAWDKGLVFKLDATQEVVWEITFEWGGSNFINRLSRIVQAADNSGYVVCGTVAHNYAPGPGGRLGYLAKVSPEGDSLWSRRLFYYEQPDSIEYEHHIHDLQATPDGGYFMSGYTLDRAAGATPPRQRAWFIKVDSEGCLIPGCGLVDTESPNEEGPALLIYPNPADQYLNIYLGDNGGQEWTFLVLDGVGRQLGRYEAPLGQTTYMVPVGNYPVGSYYLQVVDEQGRRLKIYSWVKG